MHTIQTFLDVSCMAIGLRDELTFNNEFNDSFSDFICEFGKAVCEEFRVDADNIQEFLCEAPRNMILGSKAASVVERMEEWLDSNCDILGFDIEDVNHSQPEYEDEEQIICVVE